VEPTKGFDHFPPADTRVAHGGFQLGVAEQLLDLPEIHPGCLAARRGRPAERVLGDADRCVHAVGQFLEPDAGSWKCVSGEDNMGA